MRKPDKPVALIITLLGVTALASWSHRGHAPFPPHTADWRLGSAQRQLPRDIVPGCDATFTADSESELLEQAGAQAAEAHGITDPPPTVLDAVKAAITQD